MTDSPSARPTRRRRGFLVFLRDVLVIVLIAALVSFVIKTFVVRSFYIPSASMERTLLINDRILVDELTPRWTGYERGDVVVFKDPGGWLEAVPQTPAQPPLIQAVDWVLNFVGISATDSQDHLVKRVIGVAGDHVVCCNALGQITINGSPVDESSYLNLPEGDTAASNEPFDVVVPEDSVWLLGDNRDRSRDSRAHQELPSGGFVPLGNIVGKAFLTTWPLDRLGTIDGHHEIFNGVPDPE
ncbi:signal peptidase I [Microbacterium sp. p3-SID336]|uniref:signal peptidase I n=1 Tax=Microbacterium sp. p3-SID336 TaxID=2916212 RepID=UPI0021A5ACF1|nr:signal peptidase I [Microbacterium sp. p3-SID336]MCT1477067.1 signal peptidase I [Microbacterium sp. p3-SID336]